MQGREPQPKPPRSLCNLTHLDVIHMATYSLNGRIPSCLGKGLKEFNLNENCLSRPIPPALVRGPLEFYQDPLPPQEQAQWHDSKVLPKGKF